ncbi:MAG: hypothetical protein IJQ82_00490 [Selenomonadaceae bacterium]|nr:hypothetical protein [Selenomonadaceae bacterium]
MKVFRQGKLLPQEIEGVDENFHVIEKILFSKEISVICNAIEKYKFNSTLGMNNLYPRLL